MGFLDTIKGWFNIGGVKVKLEGISPSVSKTGSEIPGRVVLTSKSDKQVTRLRYRFVLEKTSGSGDDKKTKEYILGEVVADQPFEIKAGESKSFDFVLPYSIEKGLKDMGGVLGAVGKVGSFLASEKLEYYVIGQCDVKGTAFSPSNKVKVTVTGT